MAPAVIGKLMSAVYNSFTTSGYFCTFSPIAKMLLILYSSSISKILGVMWGSGPSSKVRATILFVVIKVKAESGYALHSFCVVSELIQMKTHMIICIVGVRQCNLVQ